MNKMYRSHLQRSSSQYAKWIKSLTSPKEGWRGGKSIPIATKAEDLRTINLFHKLLDERNLRYKDGRMANKKEITKTIKLLMTEDKWSKKCIDKISERKIERMLKKQELQDSPDSQKTYSKFVEWMELHLNSR